LIEELRKTDAHTYSTWQLALRNAATDVSFFKTSDRFPLGSPGKINTYAIFADLFRQLISPEGQAGLILPNGLVTGFTYRDFLRHLLSTKTLASFFGFENEDKLFKSVHNETKFGLLTITGGRRRVEQPWFTAHIGQPEQIADPARRYALSIDEIEAINPNTLNLPAFRWAKDAEVTAGIHKAAPVFVRNHQDGTVENQWRVRFKTLFNMATDSGSFIDHRDIAQLVVERRGPLAILRDGRELYPLYEGKMFWHFNHRYGTYEGQTEKQANKGVLPRVTDAQHNDPAYRIEPRYWVDSVLTHEALAEDVGGNWFFSWRDVGPSERTFVGTVVPKTALGHVAPILLTTSSDRQRAALSGVLSSLLVDYAARQKSTRMTFFVVEQLPIIVPSVLAEKNIWLGSTPESWLSDRVLELCYTNEELALFAADLGFNHPPFRWQPERRVVLQAEIDAAVLQLYGLNRTQTEWLLDSFTVLRKYEEADHGEFRTKRLVLEIYDQISTAKQAGRAYQTRLKPAPADPSCCHSSASRSAMASRHRQKVE
jgi:hypothetical protein